MKKTLSLLLLSVFFFSTPVLAFSPLPIGRSNSGVSTAASAQSNTLSFTNNIGTLLVVFVVINLGGDKNQDLHGATTYNGVPMTYIGRVFHNNSPEQVYAYYLVNPFIGTANIVANITGGVNTLMQTYGISYIGAALVGEPYGVNVANSSGSATALSSTINVKNSGSWIVALGANRNSMVSAVGTGAVSKVLENDSFASMSMDSNGPVTPGSQSYGYSGASASTENMIFGIVISPLSSQMYSASSALKLIGGNMTLR